MDNDYLIKKPPLQALFLFSLPMIIGNLFQQTYTMVDSAIVGRYVSEQALAAVGASYALTNIFISWWKRLLRPYTALWKAPWARTKCFLHLT